MKKTYIQPNVKAIAMRLEGMVASSGEEVGINNGSYGTGQLGKEDDFEDIEW